MLVVKSAHFLIGDQQARAHLLIDDPESGELILQQCHLFGVVFIGRLAEASKACNSILDLIIRHLDPPALRDLDLQFSLDHTIDAHVVDLPKALDQLPPREPQARLALQVVDFLFQFGLRDDLRVDDGNDAITDSALNWKDYYQAGYKSAEEAQAKESEPARSGAVEEEFIEHRP